MLPPAVVEQQAKLGVSAEESKALRAQRQQARFRDRGGAFKPSESNPLLDILLARTVSGESPSKLKRQAKAKAVGRASPRRKSKVGTKVNDDVPEQGEGGNAVAGSSKAVTRVAKSRTQTSNRRKSQAADMKSDATTKPAPKRRGRPPNRRETAPEPDSDIERPPAKKAQPKSKSTSNSKRKDAAPTTSTSEAKPKTKPKPKAKQKLPEKIIDVLVSDDDQTLVEAPHKPGSSTKPNGMGRSRKRAEEEDESDEDAPILKRAKPISKAAATKSSKKPGITGKKKQLWDIEEEEDQAERPVPRPTGDGKGKGRAPADAVEEIEAEGCQTKRSTKARGMKRRPADDDDDDDTDDAAAVPPAKRGKPTSNAVQLPDADFEREPAPVPRTTETGKGKSKDVEETRLPEKSARASGKRRQQPVVKESEQEDRERPLGSKTKKRRKEDDNNDDRPRKVVKVADAGSQHPSSAKLKENNPVQIPSSKQKRDQPGAPRSKQSQGEKPPSRSKAVKGPPLDVLERIKASVAQHRRLADSGPDELDCLS